MAYARRARSTGGGIGGAITVLVIVGLLALVGWVAWQRMRDADDRARAAASPGAVVERWKNKYGLNGQVPEPLGDEWRFSFDKGPYWQSAPDSPLYPTAWVEIQVEGGRLTALSIATSRNSEAAPPMGLIAELAGEAEGRMLLDFVRELGGMEDGSAIERETALYRFFGWRRRDESNPRRAVVCVALKAGGPRTLELYAAEKAAWAAMPKAKPEPAKAPAAEKPAAGEPAGDAQPVPAREQ